MYVAFDSFGIRVGGLFSPEYQLAPWSWDRVVDLLQHIWVPVVLLAIVGTAALLLVVVYLTLTSFGTMGRYDGYLTLRLSSPGRSRAESSRLLGKFCRAVKQISTRQTGEEEGAEFVYQVGLRDRERSTELLDELRGLEGVTHVSLVLRSELSEV